jgi:hypothetical protein
VDPATSTATGARSVPARVVTAPARAVSGRRMTAPVVLATVMAIGSLLLAGCTLDPSGSPASQLSGWMTTSDGGAAIGQVEVDSANIDLALARHDPPSAIKTVCALLTTDAQTAIGNLPTPNATLTDDLNNAYEDAAAAGNDCYNGSGGASSLLSRSAKERAKIDPMLDSAVSLISAITGHVPSTSTTLAPSDSNDPFAPGTVATGP